MSVQSYPLTWPEGWKRTTVNNRKRAAFNRKEVVHTGGPVPTSWNKSKALSVRDGTVRVIGELARMGVADYNLIISTNVPLRLDGMPRSDQAEPSDPGVAVYWRAKENTPMRCMAVDRYDRVADNLAAIAATLEAMRAIERHGGAEILNRAFLGFAALPEKASQSWRLQLGFKEDAAVTADAVKAAFRALAHQHHPDKGGDPDKWQDLCLARENALRDLQESA
jgi:hypothetical protein